MKLVNDLWFPSDDIHMAKEYLDGHTQLDTLDMALTFCTKTRIAVDAGAHIGLFSLHMAQVFDQVLAFEPNPPTVECLRENTKNRPNILVYQLALSNCIRPIGIKLDEKHEGNTGGAYVDFSGETGYTTHTVELDHYDLPVLDLFKADVEGGELHALQGAVKTIDRCSPVILVEEKHRLMARQGVKADGVSKFLASLGYVQARRSRRDFVYVRS